MTDVKPATDEDVDMARRYHDRAYIPGLIARIDADREEIAANAHLIAEGIKVVNEQAAEIAALKAEVERLTPAFLPCHVCGGKGISDIIHGAVVRCENCDGTGRAR